MERWKSGGSSNMRNKSKAKEDEDFQEEEVWGNWGAMRERENSNTRPKKSHHSSSTSRVNNNHGHEASSPRTIPEWSKVHYKKPNMVGFSEGVSWAAPNNNVDMNDDDDGDDDYEKNDHEMVPPHEIVARRVARGAVVSSSMCEGVGRTLKGRDLSKLRNAILTKTGFLE